MSSSSIHITAVTDAQQINTVAALARTIWQEHFTPIIGDEQVAYMLWNFQSAEAISKQMLDGMLYFLLSMDYAYCGYFAIKSEPAQKRLMLSKLYVLEDFRKKGLARATLNHVERFCRERGLDMIWLTVNKYNTDAIMVYERMGFRNVHPVVQDIGGGFVMDDFIMEKRLE